MAQATSIQFDEAWDTDYSGMTIVLDTSIMIDHLRRNELAVSALRGAVASGELVAASVLSKVEVMAAMRQSEVSRTRRLFESIEWLDATDEIAERAGTLANQYSAAFSGIDPVDYVIAATAELFSAELWTHNVRHFPMFPDLQPPY